MRERADRGRVRFTFGEEPELVRRARAAEAYPHTNFYVRRPRELPQVPAAVLGREAPHVVRHAAAGEVQVDGIIYIKVVDGVVDLCVENVASMARVSDGVASAGMPSPTARIETLNHTCCCASISFQRVGIVSKCA